MGGGRAGDGQGRGGGWAGARLGSLSPPATSSADHVPRSPSKGRVLSLIQRDATAQALAGHCRLESGLGSDGRLQPHRPLRPGAGRLPPPGLGPHLARCSGRDLSLPQAGLGLGARLSGRGHPAWLTGPGRGRSQLPMPRLASRRLTAARTAGRSGHSGPTADPSMAWPPLGAACMPPPRPGRLVLPGAGHRVLGPLR